MWRQEMGKELGKQLSLQNSSTVETELDYCCFVQDLEEILRVR